MIYTNGNATIQIQNDGTRIIEYQDKLNLEYPLNLDIRVSTGCSFASTICKDFCHESAVTNGKDCNYEILKSKLEDLPKGIELAIGCNTFTEDLYRFLDWCQYKQFICNLTINQGHLQRDSNYLGQAIMNDYVKGLGISYRNSIKWNVHQFFLDYPNTVFHVIAGIDTFKDVENLASKGVKKILVLGEKDFGYNATKVDLNSINHRKWFWWISKLFKKFEVVSFDNLALEQLQIRRFFSDESWNTFNQGEYSFYIDAANEVFKPSSRSSDSVNWNDATIKDYFQQLQN